jgi:hypothetical protein
MGIAALELTLEEKLKLLELIPATYPDVYCDHITLGLMKQEDAEQSIAYPQDVKITGIADDGHGLQVLTVTLDGKNIGPKGQVLHLTYSLDSSKNSPAAFDVFAKPGKEKEKPYKPAASNGLLRQLFDEAGHPKSPADRQWVYTAFETPVKIKVEPVYLEGEAKSKLNLRAAVQAPENNSLADGVA